MTLTGDAQNLYNDAMEAADKVRADVEQSVVGLKALHAKRLGSEQHKAAWERALRGYKASCEVHRRLHELARQLRRLAGTATLTEAECALFSFVQDPEAVPLPEVELT
jgi:hypothetical protein